MDALKDGPSNDGLIQRFQLLVWPDPPREWNYVDRAPDAASEQQAARVFRKLVELDFENPLRFRFDAEAQELFSEWSTELEAKIRGGELHPALVSHLSKYRKLMPALALLFQLAESAAGNGDTSTVSLRHAQQAAAWCEYLESHARRVYSCVATPQLRAARELADKIKNRKVGTDGFFSCRDVYLKGWSGLDSPEAVKQGAEVLQDAGWVRAVCGESLDPFGPWAPVQSVRSQSEGLGMSTTTLHPATRSRWLDWKPKAQILADRAESEPAKTSKTDFVVFVGSTSAESPEIEAGPDPAELALASGVLNRAGVRIMALEGGATIGVRSDLDGPEVRAALRTLGSERLPVRYLDGAGVPMRYRARRVDGEPVPMNVLAAMERHPAEPWEGPGPDAERNGLALEGNSVGEVEGGGAEPALSKPHDGGNRPAW